MGEKTLVRYRRQLLYHKDGKDDERKRLAGVLN